MTEVEPCRVCESPVRIEIGYGPARAGRREASERRVCTDPECPTNVGPKRNIITP